MPTVDVRRAKKLAAAVATLALAAVLPSGAFTAGEKRRELGEYIASCAQMHLGPRENPPSLTCGHDGLVHTFATFGDMVKHMLETHGWGGR